MTTNINPKEFIKAQNDAKEAIIEAHFKGSIEYINPRVFSNMRSNANHAICIARRANSHSAVCS